MDTTSKQTQFSHKASELEKFQLYFEYVPVKKQSGRIKRSHATAR